ncbi:conserved hypothetical protein [uncultured Desulfobacterium sp.]|uniref:7-cyano-7-deazaguanine synthase n=1 Tax=uncultured Desulfobacterium sp. TaxID=201089 RepID=A0A445N068_9BACT|nr:conserved hypothetical protein [uncultured Desulfobacterium sp.]
MNWNVIVRVGDNDTYMPSATGEDARFFVDFYRPNSPWKMRQNILFDLTKNEIISASAHDLLVLAMAVSAADRCIERKFAEDAWQREITIHLPVINPELWAENRDLLEKSLAFLSGDNWHFLFRRSLVCRQFYSNPNESGNICLFSGGADSLVGAIDLLSEERRTSFVGQYGGGVTHKFQENLENELKKQYPKLCNFSFHYIEPPHINECTYEPSTRVRSFLFLSLATAYGSTSQNTTNLYVPENGLISLNVPLTESRTGSLSTKTTHPYFITLYNELINNIGINVKLLSPYKFKTKGQMFLECKNQALLKDIAKKTMSCSHPEYARLKKISPKTHCGRCFPCIVRRAAFFKAGLSDAPYMVDVLNAPPGANTKCGSDYRAIMMGVTRFKSSPTYSDLFKVTSTGPIASEEVSEFVDVYRRGMNEISQYLTGSVRV